MRAPLPGLRRRGLLAAAAAVSLSGFDLSLRDGLLNKCLGPLPPDLRDEMETSALLVVPGAPFPADQVDPGAAHETMCNPIFQALALNEARSEFNILLGLCVGHDSLFFKHATAMGTVLAVKDRLLGHNPLAAIYQYESYCRYLKQPLP